VLRVGADGDLETLSCPFAEEVQHKLAVWKFNPISPWRIHRDGDLRLYICWDRVFACVFSCPGGRPEGEGLL